MYNVGCSFPTGGGSEKSLPLRTATVNSEQADLTYKNIYFNNVVTRLCYFCDVPVYNWLRGTALLLKISMFCALPQNYLHFF